MAWMSSGPGKRIFRTSLNLPVSLMINLVSHYPSPGGTSEVGFYQKNLLTSSRKAVVWECSGKDFLRSSRKPAKSTDACSHASRESYLRTILFGVADFHLVRSKMNCMTSQPIRCALLQWSTDCVARPYCLTTGWRHYHAMLLALNRYEECVNLDAGRTKGKCHR